MIKQIHTYPFLINILWSNESPELTRHAQFLYEYFFRLAEQPLERHLNIPVHRFNYIPNLEELLLDESKNSATILFLDSNLILNDQWREFTKSSLVDKISSTSGNHKIYPLCFDEGTVNFLSPIQAIDLINEKERLRDLMSIYLSHNIHRQLNSRNPYTPIKIFLSHAKEDGKEGAEQLLKHINQFSSDEIMTFFDAKNIPPGSSFEEQIQNAAKESILLVMHTDAYSSREWCRKEVLYAKKHQNPILVVNQFKNGDKRSFPYLGNVRHVRYPTDQKNKLKEFDYIVNEALKEGLYIKYHKLMVKKWEIDNNMKFDHIFNSPPELISLLEFKNEENKLIIYPDPPLGIAESEILAKKYPNLRLTTPTLLPLITLGSSRNNQRNLNIHISLSEIDRSEMNRFKNQDLLNLINEITRYLMVAGMHLLYGGNFNYSEKMNYSKILIDLVGTYRVAYESRDLPAIQAIYNYSFFPVSKLIDNKLKAKFIEKVKFITVAPPKNLNIDENQFKYFLNKDNFVKKYAWAKSLTQMRKEIISNSDAQIILGGKSVDFTGRMPGLLEEFILAKTDNKPIFLIGGYGGIAEEISKLLQGQKSPKLNPSYFKMHYFEYYEFIQKYNEEKLTAVEEKVNYEDIVEYLNSQNYLNDYGLNNGLSKHENQRLFNSRNETEIIQLILKGLSILKNQ